MSKKKLTWKTYTVAGIVVGVFLVSLLFLGGENKFFSSLIQREQVVNLKTNKGDIRIRLFTEESPEIANNFYLLTKSGKYNKTIFHRVIDGFMIQGGDFENHNGTGGRGFKTQYLPDEFSESLSHTRGMVSMANKGPDTNGSQFFIVHNDATFLDGRHTVFGEVIEGMEVVDAIATTSTDNRDKPLRDVTIIQAIPE